MLKIIEQFFQLVFLALWLPFAILGWVITTLTTVFAALVSFAAFAAVIVLLTAGFYFVRSSQSTMVTPPSFEFASNLQSPLAQISKLGDLDDLDDLDDLLDLVDFTKLNRPSQKTNRAESPAPPELPADLLASSNEAEIVDDRQFKSDQTERPNWVDESDLTLQLPENVIRIESGPHDSNEECEAEIQSKLKQIALQKLLHQFQVDSKRSSMWNQLWQQVALEPLSDQFIFTEVDSFTESRQLELAGSSTTSHFKYALYKWDRQQLSHLNQKFQNFTSSLAVGGSWVTVLLTLIGTYFFLTFIGLKTKTKRLETIA